jgi:hypothetical protein
MANSSLEEENSIRREEFNQKQGVSQKQEFIQKQRVHLDVKTLLKEKNSFRGG